MANYIVVDADQLDSDITSVADAIRTKGGTTEQMAWPDGLKSAVDAIKSGGIEYGVEFISYDYGQPINVIVHGVKYRDYSNTICVPKGMFVRNISNSGEWCYHLEQVTIEKKVNSIYKDTFVNCFNLSKVTIKGTVSNFNDSAFSGCTQLQVINVPWSEGEVANAPWGATNATINYNYTGE